MPENDVEVVKSHWYKRWWGVIIILFFLFLLVFSPFYIYQVIKIYGQMKSGSFLSADDLSTNTPYDMKYISDDQSASFGNPEALIRIVEFGDFNCPLSLQASAGINYIKREYSDKVHYTWRNYPVIKETSFDLAKASFCANKQNKFWEMHDAFFAKQGNLLVEDIPALAKTLGMDQVRFEDCLTNYLTEAQLRRDYVASIDGDLQGTPTFFVNGHKFEAVISIENWETIISKLSEIYEKK